MIKSKVKFHVWKTHNRFVMREFAQVVHCKSILLRSDVAQSTNIVILSGEAAPDGGIVVNTPPGKKCLYFIV